MYTVPSIVPVNTIFRCELECPTIFTSVTLTHRAHIVHLKHSCFGHKSVIKIYEQHSAVQNELINRSFMILSWKHCLCNWLSGVVIGWTDVSSRTSHCWDHVLARAVLIDWCLHCYVWWSFLVHPWCYVWCDGTIQLGSLYPHCRFSDWWTDGSLLVVLGYSLSVVV